MHGSIHTIGNDAGMTPDGRGFLLPLYGTFFGENLLLPHPPGLPRA